MPGLKDVKTKITGVKKTSQITKAMNMVASAKLRGAQEKMESFRPYTAKFTAAMSNLSGGMEGGNLPLMEVRDVSNVEIVVVTSDRGLCGSAGKCTAGCCTSKPECRRSQSRPGGSGGTNEMPVSSSPTIL